MSIVEKKILMKSRSAKEIAVQMVTSTATSILDKIRNYFKLPVAGRAKSGIIENLNNNDLEFIMTVKQMIGSAPVDFQDPTPLRPPSTVIGSYCSGSNFMLIVLDTTSGQTSEIPAAGTSYYGYQCVAS